MRADRTHFIAGGGFGSALPTLVGQISRRDFRGTQGRQLIAQLRSDNTQVVLTPAGRTVGWFGAVDEVSEIAIVLPPNAGCVIVNRTAAQAMRAAFLIRERPILPGELLGG